MKKKNNPYVVTIELDIVEIKVSAKSKTEARKKALVKLKRKNILSLIRIGWLSRRKEISVDKM